MEPDAILLRRYAESRDQAAFAELVRRHLDGVYSSALRRLGGDSHLAEDVAQKVFIELARQARLLSRHPALTGWLYTTTRNHAANTVRTEQRRRARERLAPAMNENPGHAQSQEAWCRVAPVLDWAIDQLPEADRTAVLLRYIGRKPFEEIGATLKISTDAARMRVDRAVEKLRLVLRRRGIVSTAALLSAELAQHATAAAPSALGASVTAAALTTVPATLNLLAASVQFMTTSKLTAGLAAGLLIVASSLVPAAHQANARQAAEATLTEEERLRERTRRDLQEARAQLHKLNTTALASANSVIEPKSTLVTVAGQPSEPVPTTPDPRATGKAFLDRHPEVKSALAVWLTAKENSRWGPLFKSLHLTDAQIEEFRFLMRESDWFGRNLEMESNTYAQFSLSTGLPQNEVQRRLRALLGEQGFQEFSDFKKQQPVRVAAAQAAAGLVFTDTPMSAAQSEQLIGLLNKNRIIDRTGAHIQWETLIAEAALFLSGPQLTVLDHLRNQEKFTHAFNRAPVARVTPSSGSQITSNK